MHRAQAKCFQLDLSAENRRPRDDIFSVTGQFKVRGEKWMRELPSLGELGISEGQKRCALLRDPGARHLVRLRTIVGPTRTVIFGPV